jgi:phosphate transport system substrate-binding protein
MELMMNRRIAIASILTLSLAALGCRSGGEGGGAAGPAIVTVDGSSTVFPISQALAESFQAATPGARVTVGVSGTGGGFEKFCNGELDITGASRPIRPSEIEACAAKGIEFIELPVAFDGLAVVVHPSNTWVDHLTVDELKRMWEPTAQGTVMRWNQIRPTWPDQEIRLFGPGVDSGTFDYFTAAVVGEEKSSRGDFTSSEDDNVLVQGVSSDPLALGYFGLAYYEPNAARLKLVPIDDGVAENGTAPVAPSATTVADATYQPLSRPLFIYVSVASAARPEVAGFIHHLADHANEVVAPTGYIPLPADIYARVRAKFDERRTGSHFTHGSQVGVSISDLL